MPSPKSNSAALLCACRRRQSIPARLYPCATLALLALHLCLVAALGGCAAAPAPTAATPAITLAANAAPTPALAAASAPTVVAEAGPLMLVLWHAWYGEEIEQVLAELAGRFHESHPTITVQPKCVGDEEDVQRKTIAAIQAGHPPDLAVAEESAIAEFAQAGAVVPLEPYVADPEIGLTAEDRDDIFPGYREAGVFPEFGGQMLSFPFAKSALAMFYNLTALKAAGKQVPRTWDDLEATCKAVTKGNVRGLAWRENASTFDGFLYSRGASPLDEGQTRAIFNGPQGVEALDLLIRLGDEGAAYRPEGEGADRAAFARGEAVFTFGSSGDVAAYEQAIKDAGSTFAWGLTCLPQADASKPPRTALNGANMCIFKTDEARQRAAWQFVRWLTDSAQAAEWASKSGYTPMRRSAIQQLAASGWLAEHPLAGQVYDEVIPYAYPEPNVRGQRQARAIIEDAWAAALTGVMTPQEALDDAVAKTNEALAAER